MNAFLFCTSYIDDTNDEHHSLRYRKWVDYYSRMADSLGAGYIFILDDAGPDAMHMRSSEVDVINADKELPDRLEKRVNILSFQDHLGRPAMDDYCGWWRSFTYSIVIAKKYGCRKIVHIESDFYIISHKLMRYIKELDHGWTALYSDYHGFPETAIQVICEDNFLQLEEVRKKAQSSFYSFDGIAERLLPFTNVRREFVGDRIGEVDVLLRWATEIAGTVKLDYYGQLPVHVKSFDAEVFSNVIEHVRKLIEDNVSIDNSKLMQVLLANELTV